MTIIKFSEFKIKAILIEASTGTAVDEICQKYQISMSTFNKWAKYYKNLQAPIPKKRNIKLEEINKRLQDLLSQFVVAQKDCKI